MNENKSFSLDLRDKLVDSENLTISFTALSHKPTIKRSGFFGDFYITINTDSVKFNAETFYLDHDVAFANAIGKIVESKRDENGDFKVKVQFFKEIAASMEAFLKYQNGLSKSVSVGFGECEIVELKDKKDNLPHYEIKSGEIVELSAVWKGADPNAVISTFKKFQKTQGENMPVDTNLTQGETMPNNDKMAQLEAREVEIKEIVELGAISNKSDLALKAIESGMSYKDFAKSLIKDSSFTQSTTPKAKDKEVCFSLANLAHSIASGERVGEIEFKLGVNGYEIPNSYYTRFDEQVRSSDVEVAGYIPEYYRGDKFIEQVFAESNILSLCDNLTGLVGTIRVPRDNSNIQAYWVKEGDKTPTSKIGADSITLTPNTLKAKVKISRQMLGMSPFALESYIIKEIKRAIRLRLESDLLYGEKNDDCPIAGLFNVAGVQSITDYFTNTDYKKTLEFGGKLTDKNLSIANTHFFANSKAMIHLQSTHYDADSDKYLLNERASYLAGYKFVMNNLLKDNHAIFGDFKNVLVGTWGGLSVQAMKDDEGDLTFTGFYDVGMEVKRANAFVIAKS